MPLGGLGAEQAVHVHGEEGGGRVEDGRQVRHQRGQHHRDHDAAHPCREAVRR